MGVLGEVRWEEREADKVHGTYVDITMCWQLNTRCQWRRA